MPAKTNDELVKVEKLHKNGLRFSSFAEKSKSSLDFFLGSVKAMCKLVTVMNFLVLIFILLSSAQENHGFDNSTIRVKRYAPHLNPILQRQSFFNSDGGNDILEKVTLIQQDLNTGP